MLATLQLFGQYIVRKMFDLNPWPPHESRPVPPSRLNTVYLNFLARLRDWWAFLRRKPR